MCAASVHRDLQWGVFLNLRGLLVFQFSDGYEPFTLQTSTICVEGIYRDLPLRIDKGIRHAESDARVAPRFFVPLSQTPVSISKQWSTLTRHLTQTRSKSAS